MGSSINIGLITYENIIKNSAIDFLKNLKLFSFEYVHLPKDGNYNNWVTFTEKECTIYEAVDYCIKYNMAHIVGNFSIDTQILTNVRFSFEKDAVGKVCLLIQIPESSLFSRGIDIAEAEVKKMFENTKGFLCGFCDNEAHIDERKYAISVQYSDKIKFSYQSWKIDGFTERY